MVIFFDQIDCVAMESPLGLFMGFHKETCIDKATIVKPIFYKRHIDVISAFFKFTFRKGKDKNLKNLFFKKRHIQGYC